MTGRFQVITGQPQVFPGACLVCKGIEGPFIDTLQGDDFIGAFFFCYNCVKEMATVLEVSHDTNALEQHKAYVQGAKDTIHGVERHLRDYFERLDLNSVAVNVPDFNSDGPANSADSEAVAGNESGEERGGVSTDDFSLENGGSPFDEGAVSVSSSTGDGPSFSIGA